MVSAVIGRVFDVRIRRNSMTAVVERAFGQTVAESQSLGRGRARRCTLGRP